MSPAVARCRMCRVQVTDVEDHLVQAHGLTTWSSATVRTYFEHVPRNTIVGDEPLPFEELSQP